jgi:hypothetical protein
MAIDLKLDENWDLAFEDGDLVLVKDRLEVLQSTKLRLLFIQTEWAYNFSLGVPWANGMFDIRMPRVKKEAYLKDTIIQTVNVRALTDFDFNFDREENGAFVAFKAETTYGPIDGEIST